jgi:acetoin utilization protein AcuB
VLVRDIMTPNPTTVRPDSDPMAAQTLLRYGKFRRLPVVDEDGKLVGMVTDSDLEIFFSTAPSPGVVKRQFRVDQVMTSPALSVSPNYPLEEAAKLMLEHRLGGLPVVENEKVVGIITESNIFAQLVEALGGDTPLLRVTVELPDRPGQFARVATRLAELNCNICSVVSARTDDKLYLTMRLEGSDRDTIVQAVQELEDIELTHIWQSDQADDASP